MRRSRIKVPFFQGDETRRSATIALCNDSRRANHFNLIQFKSSRRLMLFRNWHLFMLTHTCRETGTLECSGIQRFISFIKLSTFLISIWLAAMYGKTKLEFPLPPPSFRTQSSSLVMHFFDYIYANGCCN